MAPAPAPGGGKLGGGMEVGSMVGRARAGEAEGPAAGPPGWNVGACMAREGGVAATAGVGSSMGANRAVEADASLRRCESDLRGGMMCQLGRSYPRSFWVCAFVFVCFLCGREESRPGGHGFAASGGVEEALTRKCSNSTRTFWFEHVVSVNGSN